MFRLTGSVLLSIFMTYAASAEELLVDATDAVAFSQIMQEMGYQAKLEKDKQGDPMIKGRTSRTTYTLYFYGCKEHTNCASIVLFAGYNLKEKPFSIEKINDWNTKTRFGSAFLDKDGDPNVKLSVNLYGGTSKKNLEDTLVYWQEAVSSFEKMINW